MSISKAINSALVHGSPPKPCVTHTTPKQRHIEEIDQFRRKFAAHVTSCPAGTTVKAYVWCHDWSSPVDVAARNITIAGEVRGKASLVMLNLYFLWSCPSWPSPDLSPFLFTLEAVCPMTPYVSLLAEEWGPFFLALACLRRIGLA